ncbi:MAG: hypothetical protein FJZ78_06650 [Bacteroidetes bacterium]|nr:hypothetical protein [Bacteroidota bacterium]
MQKVLTIALAFLFVFTPVKVRTQTGLPFKTIPTVWDEGLHLGNGMLGAIIWQKEKNLRMALDRADLWDERQVVDFSVLNYKWVFDQVKNGTYEKVQQYGDVPYEEIPWPTKIPGAAIEFSIDGTAKGLMDIEHGQAIIDWSSGVQLSTFVHATKPFGWFEFTNVPEKIVPILVPPVYRGAGSDGKSNSVEGQSLERLGYQQGKLENGKNYATYEQAGAEGFRYEVSVVWSKRGNKLTGVWSIASYENGDTDHLRALKICKQALRTAQSVTQETHHSWWKDYWSRSSVQLPDSILQHQYELELYKLGSTARKGAPAITLQAVWTADNGRLPPWKGDFHHDLNTQLSYWPSYTANHTDLAETFTDWLWAVKEENKKYTKSFFGVDGLNVPGVTTLKGKPMGGWIQYSFSPTVSAWLAQHFYWQWRYTGDRSFLEKRAYPYLTDVSTFLNNIMLRETVVRNGLEKTERKLTLSSSPEYNDNRVTAWFRDWTNYDLALVKFCLEKTAELAVELGKQDEATQWKTVLSELPPLDVNETGLTIAPGQNLEASHRHIAQLMALHPLGLLNPDQPDQKEIIQKSLRWLENKGTDWWTGYSFSWAACLYARAGEGERAATNLKVFAENFCLPNSFHANGDQKTGRYSNFRYRPFTLEGNLAFAQGVHEMLVQSHQGFIEIFPAVPGLWGDLRFDRLLTEGGFEVSAKREKGITVQIKVTSKAGGTMKIKLDDGLQADRGWLDYNQETRTATFYLGKGEMLTIERKL